MTAPHIVDPETVLREALGDASPDLMRHLLQTMINSLLSAEADAVVGAEYGRPSPDRVSQRTGYRHRNLDTRIGTIDIQIPKLRQGTFFPESLLERRKRSESALITVVADCYLAGVSTRRMDKLVKTLGIHSLSKSQVSRMATELDKVVDEFRHRPLSEAGPFTFVAADALTMKVREGARDQHGRPRLDRSQRRRAPGSVGHAGRNGRDRGGLDDVLRRPRRPRPHRGPSRHE